MQRDGSMIAACILACGLLAPGQATGSPIASPAAVAPELASPWIIDAGGDEDSAGAAAMHGLAGTNWVLEDIEGRGVIDNLQSTLAFDADGRVSGNAGCNRFAGGASIAGSAVSFGNLASTRMACAPAIDDQEMRYLDALGRVAGWRTENGLLHLLDASGQSLLRFAPAG